MSKFDVIVIGAGGAGMMCAMEAGKRQRRVLLLDHSTILGAKILVSGGGRCNFTNKTVGPENYLSRNPHFAKSALSRYRPQDFVDLVVKHKIAYHEKKLGQLFCDKAARDVVSLLKNECEQVNAEFKMATKVENISYDKDNEPERFTISTSSGVFKSRSLVIATGGLSFPKIGATSFGYEIAKKFGLRIVETAPALDGFVFTDEKVKSFCELAGLSLECTMTANQKTFRENMLFTHAGISGPAALQASLYWKPGDEVVIDLLPDVNASEYFFAKLREGSHAQIKNLLTEFFPQRFCEKFCSVYLSGNLSAHLGPNMAIHQMNEGDLQKFCRLLNRWVVKPAGTVGYSKAEVTRGGVDTDELSSKTMEAKKVPGLYFIGEVVDVTGWLGGYNFQWAWASGWAAGQVV